MGKTSLHRPPPEERRVSPTPAAAGREFDTAHPADLPSGSASTRRDEVTSAETSGHRLAEMVIQPMFWEKTLEGEYVWHTGPVIGRWWEFTGKKHKKRKDKRKYGVWRRKSELRAKILELSDDDAQVKKLLGLMPSHIKLLQTLKRVRSMRGPRLTPGARIMRLADLLDKKQEYVTRSGGEIRRQDVQRPKSHSLAAISDLVENTTELRYALEAAESERADDGHSLHRHGPHLSDIDLTRRLTTGKAADEAVSFTETSTRFDTFQVWVKCREQARGKTLQEEQSAIHSFKRIKSHAPRLQRQYADMKQKYDGLEARIREIERKVEANRAAANATQIRDYFPDEPDRVTYDPVAAVDFDTTESTNEVDHPTFKREKEAFDTAYAQFLRIEALVDQRIAQWVAGDRDEPPKVPPRPNTPNPPLDPPSFSLRKIVKHTRLMANLGVTSIGKGFESDKSTTASTVPNPLRPTDRTADGTVYSGTVAIGANITNSLITLETLDGKDWRVVQFFPTTEAHDYEIA